MKIQSGPVDCRKEKESYFTLPIIIQRRMQRRSNSVDYMPALMLPVIGEGKLAHFEPGPGIRGGEGPFCGDLEWRDGVSGGVGPRSFPRPQGPSPTDASRTHDPSSLRQPSLRHSDPTPPGQHQHHHHQVTETVITLLPSHLVASSPAVARRAYFHLRSDDTGERSASNQSLSDWRDTTGEAGTLPRLALPSQSHGSADSNARHSSGVFVLPTDPLRVDSPRLRGNHRERLGGEGRGSQWSPISKDSVDNTREISSSAAKPSPELDVERTTSHLLRSDLQDLEAATGRIVWKTGMKSEVRPGEGNALRGCTTQERTFVGVTKVNPLTRMNQILSKSNTNLSKSEFLSPSGRRDNNNTSNLQRHCSEVNLVNRLTGYDGHRGLQSHPTAAAQRPPAPTTLQQNRKTLIKSQSQPLLRPGNDRQRPPANRKSYRGEKGGAKEDTLEAEEKTKQERIIEWLLDIDGYAEPPDSPIIFEDGPLQSDTAIHVVYDGD